MLQKKGQGSTKNPTNNGTNDIKTKTSTIN
jgi:hypothetical protein